MLGAASVAGGVFA